MHRRTPKIKTEVRQEQIAQAALELIAQRGLNHLSLGAVAAAVGVVPSAVYRHYQGRDGVLGAVLELISRNLLANVEAVCQANGHPLDRLHLLLGRHVELVRHQAGIPRVLFSEQIFTGHAKRRRRVYQILQDYLRAIGAIISAGQQAGHIRTDLKPDRAALMFLGLVQPAVILWLMSNRRFDVASHVEESWRLFRQMLQSSESGARQPGRLGCGHLNTKSKTTVKNEKNSN